MLALTFISTRRHVRVMRRMLAAVTGCNHRWGTEQCADAPELDPSQNRLASGFVATHNLFKHLHP